MGAVRNRIYDTLVVQGEGRVAGVSAQGSGVSPHWPAPKWSSTAAADPPGGGCAGSARSAACYAAPALPQCNHTTPSALH
eukprot:221163-Prorocentrum_minimum.AAC.3